MTGKSSEIWASRRKIVAISVNQELEKNTFNVTCTGQRQRSSSLCRESNNLKSHLDVMQSQSQMDTTIWGLILVFLLNPGHVSIY